MSQTLEERVAALEQEVAALRARPWLGAEVKKDWRSTIGWAEARELHEAAAKAGQEYRRSQTYEKEIEARGGVGY